MKKELRLTSSSGETVILKASEDGKYLILDIQGKQVLLDQGEIETLVDEIGVLAEELY